MSGKKPPPQKEAVVFILDAFPSMNAPYPTHKQQQQPDDGASDQHLNNSAQQDENFPTRLECAKQAIESMLFNMMLNSRSDSKALVIVTKTKKTRHHLIALDEDPDDKSLRGNLKFPNLTELGWIKNQTMQEQVMRPPDIRMIRQLWKVQPVASMERAQSRLQGDICDALILAADALYRCAYANPKSSKTPYRYRRKIVLLTDACHQIVLDLSQVCLIIDNLRKMECPLHVLGMGFGSKSVEYENPMASTLAVREDTDGDNDNLNNLLGHPDQPAIKKAKQEPGTVENLDGDDDNNPQPDEVPSAEEEQVAGQYLRVYDTCKDREQLLGSISEKTGGSVISIASMQELLDAKVGKRIRKGSPRNLQLHVGPGMTIAVKALKLLVQEGSPKIIKHAVTMDHRGAPQLNGIGQEMSEPTTEIRTFWRHINVEQAQQDGSGDEADQPGMAEEEGAEDELVEVAEEDITTAIRYGKDLIPWGEQDKAGLKIEEDCGYSDTTFDAESPYIHILGYVRRDAIPYRLIVGPPYGITGSLSKRACTVVAALSRTLHKSEFVALCTMKLSKTGIPCLAGLFPFEEGTKTDRLLLFKLPFCDDVKCFGLEGFQDVLEEEEGGEESKQSSQSQYSVKSLHSKNQASDDLVDSLMLPDDAICSGKIPSPFFTSFNKTILKRATATEQEGRNEMDDIVAVREQLDLMAIPKDAMNRSAPALEKFRAAFPLKMKKVIVKAASKGGRGGGRKNPTFRDHL